MKSISIVINELSVNIQHLVPFIFQLFSCDLTEPIGLTKAVYSICSGF